MSLVGNAKPQRDPRGPRLSRTTRAASLETAGAKPERAREGGVRAMYARGGDWASLGIRAGPNTMRLYLHSNGRGSSDNSRPLCTSSLLPCIRQPLLPCTRHSLAPLHPTAPTRFHLPLVAQAVRTCRRQCVVARHLYPSVSPAHLWCRRGAHPRTFTAAADVVHVRGSSIAI